MTSKDTRTAAGLCLLFDSSEDGEATSAFLRLRAILARTDTRLCDLLANAEFRKYISQATGTPNECGESAPGNAADRKLEEQCERLARMVERLRDIGTLCRACESKRRLIGLLLGFFSAWIFSRYETPRRVWSAGSCYCVAFALTPVVAVVCRWRLLLIGRSLEWKSIGDNRIARRIREWISAV